MLCFPLRQVFKIINISKKDEFTITRFETFFDAVFAIILTILVLELKIPHFGPNVIVDNNAMLMALKGLMPKFISWMLSFLVLIVIWLNHHRLMKLIKSINFGLFLVNINLL